MYKIIEKPENYSSAIYGLPIICFECEDGRQWVINACTYSPVGRCFMLLQGNRESKIFARTPYWFEEAIDILHNFINNNPNWKEDFLYNYNY